MSVKNVVRVMNFHALVRVDNAKKLAAKYMQMQESLMRMMACIANNRNFRLDKSIMQPPEDGEKVHIYLGSDFGFCGNYNSRVNEQVHASQNESLILIGKKLHVAPGAKVLLRMERKELGERFNELEALLEDLITSRRCSSIHLTYNHYENTTTIYLRRVRIYPLRTFTDETYTEDFEIEGDLTELYSSMMASYVAGEISLATINSRAAENVLRQNATTDSLKRIEEREEEQLMADRRVKRDKEFKKVIESYSKKQLH